VALGSNNSPRDVREIRDIQGNRKVGAVRGSVLVNALVALSPDGQQFTAWPAGRDQIGVWVVKTEKPRGTIAAPGNSTPRLLMFAGNERLIAVGNQNEIYVWGMPDARPERSIPLPMIPGVLVAGLSPGGRYLALSLGDVQLRILRVFDLTTGSIAGEIRLSGFKGKVPACHAIAFSPDGQELAALYETPEESTLFAFRAAGGQLAGHVKFEDSLQALLNSAIWQGGHALEWFPGRKRWLAYGRGVIDRAAGKLVWSLPRDKSGAVQFGHVLDDDRLLVLGTEKQDAAVVVREVPSQ
jgi:dipeptidyl aminopeptidase/acylaminoacyl peptidase